MAVSTSPVMVSAAASPPFASSAAAGGPNSTDSSGGAQLGPNGEPVPRVVHQGWLKKRGETPVTPYTNLEKQVKISIRSGPFLAKCN